jgi:glycosyltransferase involved in cell wall biosynthesis
MSAEQTIPMPGQRVVVVFPAYNEEANIARAVTDFLALDCIDEVIVIDNNSRDNTAACAASAGATVVSETRQGYGNALQRGLRDAAADFIVLAEPDGTFVARDVRKLLAYSDDFDLVCGTRTTPALIWSGANMGWFLRYGNWMVAKLLEFLHNGPALTDCGCTLRLISARGRDQIIHNLSVGGSHFLPDMLIQSLKAGLRVIEIPVNYRSRVGESKITGSLKGTLKTGFNMIGLILLASFRKKGPTVRRGRSAGSR